MSDSITLTVEDTEQVDMTVEEAEQVDLTMEDTERVIEGISPTVTMDRFEGGIRITITDRDGEHSAIVNDGEKGDPGNNGYSPVVSVQSIEGGHRITIEDKTGQHSFDVMNGDTGTGIVSIQKTGTAGLVDTYTITLSTGQTVTFTVTNGQDGSDYVLTAADKAEIAEITDALPERVTSLTGIQLNRRTYEAVGIPVYVENVAEYSAYGLTETGWYVFARIAAKSGTLVTAQTVVTGAAGYIATVGNDHVDVAVRFEVASISQEVTVAWGEQTETFVFRATDLAVRNLDYRTTFYVYDLAPFVTWTYALTADATFTAGKRYFTLVDGAYVEAEVTAGASVPANTYYNHSKLHIAGMVRNVTYRLNEMVDAPIEIVLPVVPDDGYGAWFEIQMQYNTTYSVTLLPEDNTVKGGTTNTQAQTAGINVIDLQYADVNGVKMWTLLNTHTNLPTT